MKKFTILSIGLLITFKLIGQEIDLIALSKKISAENIKQDVYKLASENMNGRETGEEGQKLAAAYIFKQFRDAGISSYQLKNDSLSYFQEFLIYKKKAPIINLLANGFEFKAYEDFTLSGYNNFKRDNIELEFLGAAHDSIYQNKDFSNKAVLFLTRNLYAAPVKASDIIRKTNSKIVFYCNPINPNQIQTIIRHNKSILNHRTMLDPYQFPSQNPFDSISHKEMYYDFQRTRKTYQGSISEKAVAKILELRLKDLKKYISENSSLWPNKREITLDLEFENTYDSKPSENVIACIPGTEKKEEYIVITAHYDHLGRRGNKVFYGANDNASGTAALIEIAKAIKDAVDNGLQLKRSIIFAALSGEEKGLLGSKYFVEKQTFPHTNIKANLNIDMLGRRDINHKNHNFIYLIGASDLNPKLKTIGDSLNHLYPNLELDYSYDTKDNFLYSASDQASFVKKNIPSIFYFNGLNDDYHRTTDTPDKLDYQSVRKVSGLIFLTAIELANQK
ncbi:M28 family metallopeptidase [Marinifilum sp.]|uniref:M28 family metallopeptidase n=1 Tax=Marinifilum sp. TaxID=2033137 RepID=UPI003BAB2305